MRTFFAMLGATLQLCSAAAHARDVTVTFTEAEANTVVELFDMAVKTGGLRVAPAAVALTHKIEQAARAGSPQPAKPPQTTPAPRTGGE